MNKNMQQLKTQVTELGAATELTLGFGGSSHEGRHGWQQRRRTIETSEQVTELGAATELTLGFQGKVIEGSRGRPGKLWHSTTGTEQIAKLGTATELTLGSTGNRTEGMIRRGFN